MELQVKILNVPEVIERLKTVPMGAQTAVARAINDALTKGRTEISSDVYHRYNISKRDVASAMHVYKATAGKLLGFIRVESTQFSIIYFDPRDKRPGGVAFKELRGGKNSVLPHSFIRKIPKTGHVGTFSRIELSRSERSRRILGYAAKKHGLPIMEQVGLSVPQMAGGPEAIRKLEAAMSTRATERLEHYVDLFLRQGSTKTPPPKE
jgi:hypothetical protein